MMMTIEGAVQEWRDNVCRLSAEIVASRRAWIDDVHRALMRQMIFSSLSLRHAIEQMETSVVIITRHFR